METPHREASTASASPCADGDIESVKREYEAYRLKTKDWQTKVRDRDAKMRVQLQETTDMLVAKDAELEGLSKRASALESQRHEWASAITSHQKIADEAALLRQVVSENEAHLAKLQSELAASESEVAHRNNELKSLRMRVGELEAAIADVQWKAGGGHILDASGGLQPALDVHVRVVADGQPYCYVTKKGEAQGMWLQEQRIPAGTLMPSPMEEVYNKKCRDAVTTATDELKTTLLTAHVIELDAVRSEAATAASIAVDRERASAQKVAERLEKDLAAVNAALAERVASLEALRSVELPNAVAFAREEVSTALTTTIRQLQAKVDDLEAYKSRAQVAMRHAAQSASSTIDTAKVREQLEQEFLVRQAHAEEGFAQRLSAALKEREGVLQLDIEAVRRDNKVLEATTHAQLQTIEALERELHSAKEQLSSAHRLLATRPEPPASASPLQEATRRGADTVDHSTQTNHHPPSAAPPRLEVPQPEKTDDVPRLGSRKSSTLGGSNTSAASFTFDAVLQSLDTSPQTAAPVPSFEVERLRQQLHHQSLQLQKHREDMREVALREKSLLEQDAVLKEQIRSMERASSRSKELQEREDYLKNIVLKALTCSDQAMRRVLMPVVAEILQLSPAERTMLLASCDK